MTPYYDHAGITIYHGDCREILPTLGDVSLIATDPPYHGIAEEQWDKQWASDATYLDWLHGVMALFPLASNGSVYLFCTPRMHCRVESVVAKLFRIIGSCVWDKGTRRLGAAGAGVDLLSLRTYWHCWTERIVIAERSNADDAAMDEAGYDAACVSTKRRIFGRYIQQECERAGVTRKELAGLFPSKTGGMTGCVSNWYLGHNVPTREQYEAIRGRLNVNGEVYLRTEYEQLRTEYEQLRTEYEQLRTEYEQLRRPFTLQPGDQWGDVWTFSPPSQRTHPTQKPVSLMRQIVSVSSRNGDTILDPFMGSGTTLRAAKDLGRRAIGIEIEEKYCEIAAERLRQEVLF